MMTSSTLHTSTSLGTLELPNRILMAPLTRSRSAYPGNLQTPMHVEYYTQRATAGLIVSEATQISPEGQGYAYTPGVYTGEQVAAWRSVTEAVHEAGGRIFCQLWHVGAVSHGIFQPNGGAPVSASPFRPEGEAYVGDLHPDGPVLPHPESRALGIEEMPRLIADYRHAAECAKAAGFDGIELHAANGYLLDQFMRSSVNRRSDGYGGSIENRLRLVGEVLDAICEIWPADRVGIRMTPSGGPGGSYDEDPETTYVEAARSVSGRSLAYLHVVRPNTHGGGAMSTESADALLMQMRRSFDGSFIANGGFSVAEAEAWINEDRADAISFGRMFLANPDLPARIRASGPYNNPVKETFYGGGAKGYTDYATLSA